MGALTIAFDTTIVGALALPWVYLIIHMFFFKDETRFLHWFGMQGTKRHKKGNDEPGKKESQDQNEEPKWTDNQVVVAVAGILLFAVTYTLGSSIERVAQDFFNDDDLRIPWLFRMSITEDRIISRVYCESDPSLVLPSPTTSPALKNRLDTFRPQPFRRRPDACDAILSGSGSRASLRTADEAEKKLKDLTWDIFGLEENGLLLEGETDTLRLRRVHDQIVVLRGATFNCLIAFSLCLFACGVKARRKNYRRLHAILSFVPGVFLVLAGLALYHHVFVDREFDPPYMEFSLLAIGGVGAFMLWFKPLLFNREESAAEKTPDAKTQTEKVQAADSYGEGPKPRGSSYKGDKGHEQDCFLRWNWGMMSFAFAFLLVAGFLGWWATEVIYVQEVIYSYNSQVPSAAPDKSGSKQASPAKEVSDMTTPR